MSLAIDDKYALKVVQGVSRTLVVGDVCTISEAPIGQEGSSQIPPRLIGQTMCAA